MTDNNPIIRTFTDAIAIMEDGQLIDDLTTEQKNLVAALNDAIQAGAKSASGELTLKIKFNLEDGMIQTQADVKIKTPKPKRARSVMWTTPENNLCRNNPKQRDIFEAIEGKPKTVRNA
jgi:hypothetical protein